MRPSDFLVTAGRAIGALTIWGLNSRGTNWGAETVHQPKFDGPHDVKACMDSGRIVIRDTVRVAGIYVASARPGLRQKWQAKHGELIAFERSLGFDPAANDADFETLQRLNP